MIIINLRLDLYLPLKQIKPQIAMNPFTLFMNSTSMGSCNQYKDTRTFIEDLKSEKTSAINCLSERTCTSIYQIGKKYKLVDEDIHELHSDCVMIFIQKIRAGKYEYYGYEPSTYVVEIAKRRVFHYNRKANHHNTEDLDRVSEVSDDSENGFLNQLELLEELLKKLSDNCHKLIRLKYLEEIKDKDIIRNNLTQYTTVDALKNHRSQCLKKLLALAKQSNFYNYG